MENNDKKKYNILPLPLMLRFIEDEDREIPSFAKRGSVYLKFQSISALEAKLYFHVDSQKRYHLKY